MTSSRQQNPSCELPILSGDGGGGGSDDVDDETPQSSHSMTGATLPDAPPSEEERGVSEVPPPFTQKRLLRAYENTAWLKSRDARLIRIISEFMETQGRLRQNQITGSIVFFGSARLKSPQQWTNEYNKCQESLLNASTSDEKDALQSKLDLLQRQKKLTFQYYDKVTTLARLITEWAQADEAVEVCRRLVAKVPEFPRNFFSSIPTSSHIADEAKQQQPQSATGDSDASAASRNLIKSVRSGLAVCTGGGPGMMEAANLGAAQVPGGRSMGMGVTLPFEAQLNPYVEPDLAFQYHYFFTRKFWMVYVAMGIVAAPGGVGTLDELMEILTLRQTGRFKKSIPIVLFGKDFWKTVINFDYLYDNGLISEKDQEMLLWTDDPVEAFEFIRASMTKGDAYPGPKQHRR